MVFLSLCVWYLAGSQQLLAAQGELLCLHSAEDLDRATVRAFTSIIADNEQTHTCC